MDGDSLEAFGGIKVVEVNRKGSKGEEKKKSKKESAGELGVNVFYSEMANGGKVGWKSFTADKDGMSHCLSLLSPSSPPSPLSRPSPLLSYVSDKGW